MELVVEVEKGGECQEGEKGGWKIGTSRNVGKGEKKLEGIRREITMTIRQTT